jgi:hypothetical protein
MEKNLIIYIPIATITLNFTVNNFGQQFGFAGDKPAPAVYLP